MFIEHSIKVRLGFRAFETAPGSLNCLPKIVRMPKRPPKRANGRSLSCDLPILPPPHPDEDSPSVAKISNWIALADIALGQGMGPSVAGTERLSFPLTFSRGSQFTG